MVLFDGDVNPLDIALKIDMIPTKNGGLSLNVYIYFLKTILPPIH